MFAKNPSASHKLLAYGDVASLGASIQDQSVYTDVTGFEYLLVVVLKATLGASATTLTFKFRTSDASAGTSPTFAKNPDGTDATLTITTSARSALLQVRRRALKQYASPTAFADGGSTSTATIALIGIGPHDTAEIPALATLLAASTFS